jgi:hypothetical protein
LARAGGIDGPLCPLCPPQTRAPFSHMVSSVLWQSGFPVRRTAHGRCVPGYRVHWIEGACVPWHPHGLAKGPGRAGLPPPHWVLAAGRKRQEVKVAANRSLEDDLAEHAEPRRPGPAGPPGHSPPGWACHGRIFALHGFVLGTTTAVSSRPSPSTLRGPRDPQVRPVS